jgi:hypothetical protein
MPTPDSLQQGRPSNPEVQNENQRPGKGVDQDSAGNGGKAPRPATEPRGAEDSSDSPKTRTDPGSGEA